MSANQDAIGVIDNEIKRWQSNADWNSEQANRAYVQVLIFREKEQAARDKVDNLSRARSLL